MPDADFPSDYPDLVAEGGLANAVRAALARVGSPLLVMELEWQPGMPERVRVPFMYACVKARSRFSQVYVAAEERLFLFDFWSQGVMLASGRTSDLEEMAQAIATWVSSECSTADLAGACGCVEVDPHAAVYERGEEVEYRWQGYLESRLGFPDYMEGLREFIVAAAAHPELRQLFPFTSMNRFCFSRCTGYPFSYDTPYVAPVGPEEYEVFASTHESLGRGTAEEAVRLVIAALPPDCGPAVPGTAETMQPNSLDFSLGSSRDHSCEKTPPTE